MSSLLFNGDTIQSDGLNAEQKQAVELALAGKNLFITGSAGTGKSHCLLFLAEALMQKGKRVAITATTGIAAVQLGGTTIHSFSGLGLAEITISELRQQRSNKLKTIWTNVDVVIIDEISMMNPETFEKISVAAQVARENGFVFGGVQIIACGDFFQLPPVWNKRRDQFAADEPMFCFETPLWAQTFDKYVELKQVFRQADPTFVKCLQRLRWGIVSPEDRQLLLQRLNAPVGTVDIKPTLLETHVVLVEKENQEKLAELPGPSHTYHMVDGFIYPKEESPDSLPNHKTVEDAKNHLKKNAVFDQDLTLKVGSQVMLITNLSIQKSLVNGSRGVVTGFSKDMNYPIVRFTHVEAVIRGYMWKKHFRKGVYVYVAQIPLKMAFAYTIHKAQGQTIDCAEMKLDAGIFEEGMAYTALSRVKSLSALSLKSCVPEVIRANPRVVKFYKQLEENALAQSKQETIKSLLAKIPSKESTTAEMDLDEKSHYEEDEEDNDEEEEIGPNEEDGEDDQVALPDPDEE